MNKTQLVNEVAEQANLTKREARIAVNVVLEALGKAPAKKAPAKKAPAKKAPAKKAPATRGKSTSRSAVEKPATISAAGLGPAPSSGKDHYLYVEGP
jgi:hypothetical protein